MHELAVDATFYVLYCGCVEMAHYIINEKWYSERHENSEQEAILIVKAAARIIREEVQETTLTKDTYPAVEDIGDKEGKGARIPDAVSSYLCRENSTFICYQIERRRPDSSAVFEADNRDQPCYWLVHGWQHSTCLRVTESAMLLAGPWMTTFYTSASNWVSHVTGWSMDDNILHVCK